MNIVYEAYIYYFILTHTFLYIIPPVKKFEKKKNKRIEPTKNTF